MKDVGAYCSAMSMNYNLHAKPAEVIIEQKLTDSGLESTSYILSRKADSLDDILSAYTFA